MTNTSGEARDSVSPRDHVPEFAASLVDPPAGPGSEDRGCGCPRRIESTPSASAFYRLACEHLNDGEYLDADDPSGDGPGPESSVRRGSGLAVVGLDPDVGAACFTSEHAFEPAFIGDACDESRAGSVAVVDVLSRALDAESLLRELRSCYARDARLLVAEPRARASQTLEAPCRRAFSRPGLASLLTRTGWNVSGWLDSASSFISCTATRSAGNEWRQLEEAQRLAQTGSGPQALTLLSELASATDALRLEVTLAIADIAFNLGEGTLALENYAKASRISPHDARHDAGLARLSLAMGRSDDALETAHSGLRRNPVDVDVAASVAIVMQSRGDPGAFQAWDAAWRLAPSDPRLAAKAASAAGNAGHFEYAVAILERAYAYGDDFGPEFHVALGLLLSRVGRFKDARREAEYARQRGAFSEGMTELDQVLAANGS